MKERDNPNRLNVTEKIVIPIIGLAIALATVYVAHQQNEILDKQTYIQDSIAQLQPEQFNREIQHKYVEIFYTEITSGDDNRQQLALSFLTEIEPTLGLKLTLWVQRSGKFGEAVEQKARKVEEDIRETAETTTDVIAQPDSTSLRGEEGAIWIGNLVSDNLLERSQLVTDQSREVVTSKSDVKAEASYRVDGNNVLS